MAVTQSSGECRLCGRSFSKGSMSRHLEACRALAAETHAGQAGWRRTTVFHLRVDGGPPGYWLHLFAPADAPLRALDQFLRDYWLECCGHMSMFTIDGQRYASSHAGELGAKSMAIRLEKVLRPGSKFEYEYDFGSTTYLKLTVVSQRQGDVQGREIRLLAKNKPHDWRCRCGKPATQICTSCAWETEECFFCDECAEEHECGEDMMLPVVDSPRMGVCGYTGDAL